MKKTQILVISIGLFTALSAHADGIGHDMWTGYFEHKGLFTPHDNNCSSGTEAFLSIGSGTETGFCIEKSQRTAATWIMLEIRAQLRASDCPSRQSGSTRVLTDWIEHYGR